MFACQRNIFSKNLAQRSFFSFSTSTNSSKTLFDKYKLGDYTLPNRIVMSSMSRCRADYKTAIPNELHVKYYSQRAKAGLILTESSPITNQAQAFHGACGIWNLQQVEGWKKVTEAVHKEGGRIFLQLWHGGRTCRSVVTGEEVIAPSSIKVRSNPREGLPPYETPREMRDEDIKYVTNQYYQAAKKAKLSGFDGIELDGSLGSLVDQFLKDATNHRTDDYGGSIENRCRFTLELMEILADVYGPGKVGIKLSPVGRDQDMYDSNPVELFNHLLKELNDIGIAYVHFVEPNEQVSGPIYYEPGEKQIPNVCKQFRDRFNGTIIANNNLTPETGLQKIRNGEADLVSFGRYFISNPDLVDRIKNNWPLNENWDPDTFYTPGAKGYTDYPCYQPK